MLYSQLILLSSLLLTACLGSRVRHIVVAPRTVRPGMLFTLVTQLIDDDIQEASVFASIVRDRQVVAQASTAVSVSANTLTALPIKVAMSVEPGDYSLHVEARSRGVLLFHNSSQLLYDPRFLAIVVQTSRPIYRAGQEVRFRVVAIHTDLRPFNDGLEVYVIDPDGFIMRRWISAYTNNGVSSLRFKLPKLAKDGYWRIRIKAWNQIEEQKIKVETYFDPLFEVHVKLHPYTDRTEEFISGSVCGLYTTQRYAEGNGTLTLYGRHWTDNQSFTTIWTEQVFFKDKEYEFQIPMEQVVARLGSTSDVELKLHASITELLSRETVEGFSHTRLITKNINIMFLSPSPAVFRPGLPFHGHVAALYEDKEKVDSDQLMASKLRIQVELELETGNTIRLPDIMALNIYESPIMVENSTDNDANEKFIGKVSYESYLEKGVLQFSFDTVEATKKIELKASYVSEDGNSVEAKLEAVPFFSPSKKFINVFSSSTNIKLDEYAIFHVKANVKLSSFQYLIISKNEITSCGEYRVENTSKSTTTLSLSVGSEMAPGFTLLVFHITADGEVLADSCFLPVDGFNKFNTEFEVNTGKDHKTEHVEARASGGEGAFIGIHAVRASTYLMQAGNEMSLGRILQQFMFFENKTRIFNKIRLKTRDGLAADELLYLTAMDNGQDTNHTFTLAGLVVFSTQNILKNESPDICDLRTELPCDSNSCYPANKTCDGQQDCSSGYDEIMCDSADENELNYIFSRTSRNEFLYDMKEADWAWREIKVNDHKGVEFEPLIAPLTGDDWFFTVFSINTDLGFSMIPEPVIFSSKRNLMMHVTGPATCYTGEQVALQVDLINNLPLETLVLVTLKGSSDYKFVNVGEGGVVSSYSARLTSGDHQMLVYLGPKCREHIDFPVAPTVEQGAVEITVVGAAQTGMCVRTHSLMVQGGGAIVNKHTSVFLDLKNRALVLTYLDIIVEETPIIPYNINRRYVFGSTAASVEIFGDIIGPAFTTVPATIESTLKTSSKGTLARVFEFGVNIWTLHYLRLTNKLKRPFLKDVLLECNAVYAQIMKRFDRRGAFINWDSSGFSVWLTAWTLRLLKAASYPDWEFLLYVDHSVVERGVSWLLNYQAANGSFYDNSTDLDSKLNSNRRDVALTAQVLIALGDCVPLLSGEVKTRAAIASQRAATYLEQSLSSLSDPYHLSLTVHALSVSVGQGDIEHGYQALMQRQRQNSEGFIYWSSREIPANPIKKENQRPFIKPRFYHEDDSKAVETTAWVLLILLHRDGVTDTSERIVQWLNSIRMTTGGFISVVDTLVALEALTEYAFRARLHEITNMDVTVEFPMSDNKKRKVHIDNSSVLFQTQLQVPKVWGNVMILAQGAGQAVVQLDVRYGIDYEAFAEVPTIQTFGLNVTEYYSTYRNKSAITIQSCFRWLRDSPAVSSAATLEIDSPTGYRLVESEAESIARSGAHPTLRDALVTHTKTYWFFEQVHKEWTCFNYTLKRWFPVANMSIHRQALLYETTARERFVQVLVNSTPLHVLNVCEVCGSYQCPYCPYYSAATHCHTFHSSLVLLSLITFFILLLNTTVFM